MTLDLHHTAAVVLAAGRGTRIGNHLPKVLYPLAGQPMVSYVLSTLKQLGLKDIYVVTGYRSEDVQASINRLAFFVYQPTPLGTGHAVSCALNEIPPDINTILVVNGDDSSFYTQQTINDIILNHQSSHSVVSILTAVVPNPSGLGRVIRNSKQEIIAIREEKEASEAEKKIKEVNIGLYLFRVDWLRLALAQIKPRLKQEIYLVDAIAIAHSEKKLINGIKLTNAQEWRGVNTQEELSQANLQMVKKIQRESTDQKVFIFDLDDTLLATNKLKKNIEDNAIYVLKNVFSITLLPDQIRTKFWETYAAHKNKNGWVSTPELGEEIAQAFGIAGGGATFKRLLYTLPFEEYIKFGAKELLTKLKDFGKRVILGYGDLIYQPIKISIFNDFVDNYHTYEKLTAEVVREINNLYANSRLIFIDDKLSNLCQFKRINPSLTTVWLKDGPYQNDLSPGFKSDYSVSSIAELSELLNKL